MKSLSEMRHCAHCRPSPEGEASIYRLIRDMHKRLPNPYCRDASCACHQARRNQEKKK